MIHATATEESLKEISDIDAVYDHFKSVLATRENKEVQMGDLKIVENTEITIIAPTPFNIAVNQGTTNTNTMYEVTKYTTVNELIDMVAHKTG